MGSFDNKIDIFAIDRNPSTDLPSFGPHKGTITGHMNSKYALKSASYVIGDKAYLVSGSEDNKVCTPKSMLILRCVISMCIGVYMEHVRLQQQSDHTGGT